MSSNPATVCSAPGANKTVGVDKEIADSMNNSLQRNEGTC